METKEYHELEEEIRTLREKLAEATDTIEAIRTGQVDALVTIGDNGHSLYSLRSADWTYRVFIEKMTESAVTLNGEGMIVFCNTAFANLVRKPLSEILGFHFDEFIAGPSKSEYFDAIQKGWSADVKTELDIVSEDRFIPVQCSITSIDLQDGLSLSVILTDLTRQKATQLELREKNELFQQLNKALSLSNHDLQQFASVASHDLQEPLRKITIFSGFLKDKSYHVLSPQAQKYLDKIVSSAHRMKLLISDILSYSRLSADHLAVEEIDINEMVNEILEDYEIKISEKRALIEIENLPKVHGNKGQLRQALQNLVGNSLKFTHPDRHPRIVIRGVECNDWDLGTVPFEHDKYTCIVVSDNGIGFDERYSNTIFNLFEKLNGKDAFEGSGIGLAITKRIIEKHNGFILVHSQEGVGSEFRIILPRVQTKLA